MGAAAVLSIVSAIKLVTTLLQLDGHAHVSHMAGHQHCQRHSVFELLETYSGVPVCTISNIIVVCKLAGVLQ